MKRWALLGAGLLILAAPGPLDPRSAILPDDAPIQIDAEVLQLPVAYKGLGGLRPVAALRLSSKDVRFGGLSGISIAADGSFVSISDRAFWLTGKLALTPDNALTGIKSAKIGLLRDANGLPPWTKRGDSEGVARMRDGRYAVSFELDPRIAFYDIVKSGAAARPAPGPHLLQTDQLARNEELESITIMPNGDILAGSERGIGGGDKALLWRAPPSSRKGQDIAPFASIDLPNGFSLTDLAAAPDGSFYALFRAYSPLTGARALIRRFFIEPRGGQTALRSEPVADIAPPFPTDNYEGLSLVTDAKGAQRLYVISDDNYRPQQKTILLAFDLPAAKSDPARAPAAQK